MTAADALLYRRVERQIPELARRMLTRFVDEIPLYAQLPREQLEGEILAITDRNLRLFFTALRAGRPLTEDELADIRSSAARRAEERVPLEAVLAAYHVGGRIGWDALVDGAEPGDEAALVSAASQVLAYVQQVTGAVAAAYLEERQSIYGEERDAMRTLASALLAGGRVDEAAARVGLVVAPAYLVLALRIAGSEETDRGVGGAIAARRTLRRVQRALDDWAGEPVLELLEPSGGAVLVPTAPEALAGAVQRLDDLISRLDKAVGGIVVGGYGLAADIADVPAAATQSRDVMQLAIDLGLPAGLYRLADLMLEYQLSRPSDALPALAAVLDPLDRNPDLVLTLETYVGHDLDRRRTAAALHVHPNTLDYRLRRIVELTSHDPSTSHGLQLLSAALCARRLGPHL